MKPTVLIGLGGIGSETVDRIYARMTEEEKRLTATAILDTDISDLKECENIDVKIQTSPAVKVGNYVYNHPDVKEWFPHTYEKINNLMLSTGAGQVRALSRLSFYSALDEGKIYPLDREVEKLTLLNDSQYQDDINIVIVGSITGGTCSGSFLQMGLYMRKYFHDKNPNAEVFIQGVFLLPHAITETGTVVESERHNLEFNSYAALKELNAAMSPSVIKKTNITLEYRPGIDGHITLGNRPYDNILFFDYENSRNLHLDSLYEYKLLLAETVYYAYISPISSDYQGRFVNTIREFIANHQESFYSASSVNKLIYPYDDIVEYLSLEWIIEEIDQEWLKFDKLYDSAIKNHDKNLDMGIILSEPLLSEIYIDNIDRLEGIKQTPFEGMIFRQTRLIDDKSLEIKDKKDNVFFAALEEHIEKAVMKDSHYQKFLGDCTMEAENLESIKSAPEEIDTLEYNLKVFEKNIDKIVQRHKNVLMQDIMSSNCNNEKMDTESSYNINHWIMSGEDGMHPVATRYFLYRIKQRIESELNQLDSEVKLAKENVDDYKIKHDIPSEMDAPGVPYYETAEEVMSMISGQTLVSKVKHILTNNQALQFNPFIKRFKRHYKNQVGYISTLIQLQLKKYVLNDVLSELDMIIKNWEMLFDQIHKGLLLDIKLSRNKLMHKHDGGKKDIFIFSSADSKQKLWNDMKTQLLASTDRSSLSNEVGKAQFALYCKMTSPDSNEKIVLNKQAYKTLLVDAYKQALMSTTVGQKLDMNLDDAVKRESRVNGTDVSLDQYLQKLTNKNLPWMHVPEKKLILTKFWGVNNIDVFGVHIPKGGITESKIFSDKEVVYLVMYHNLSVTDFAKFAVRGTLYGGTIDGAYFKAYHDLMQKIAVEPERYVTPHLDKRWDSPTYMPDLNASISEQTEKTLVEAFLLGLLEGNLYRAEQDGKEYYYAKNGTRANIIKINTDSIEAKRWLDLYDALSGNPVIVGDMMNLHEALKTESLSKTPWSADEDMFIGLVGRGEVMEILIRILTEEAKDEETYNQALDMVKTFSELISGYVKEGYGEMKNNSATTKIKELKAKMIEPLVDSIDSSVFESIKGSLR